VRRALALAAVAAAITGCGSTSSGSSGSGLTVSAAASLKNAFPSYEPAAHYSFAGSDQLAAQIRAGVKPDVFASANTKLPDALYKAGLVEKPVVFAGNRLVVAVPAGATKVKSLADLERGGVKIAMGARDVPVGSYARQVMTRLPAGQGKAILANVRSNEPDVSGVIGKITQGAVDAGFVYVTDVVATGGRVKAIELPKRLQPSVAYGAAVVKGAKHPGEARRFIDGLLNGKGAAALKKAGFEPPPG
jgi:molybdate transport system substrate-binding protein